PATSAWSTQPSCSSVESRRLNISESPTTSAPASTAVPSATPSITARFPRQWKKRLSRTSRLRVIKVPPKERAGRPASPSVAPRVEPAPCCASPQREGFALGGASQPITGRHSEPYAGPNCRSAHRQAKGADDERVPVPRPHAAALRLKAPRDDGQAV